MKRFIRLIMSVLVPAFMLAGVATLPAMAQEKMKEAKKEAKAAPAAKAEKGKTVTKMLHEDDKVRVTESTSKPGDVGPSVVRGFRVVRWLQGGTIMRTYADGTTEKFERKTGEVRVAGPETRAWSVKNVGKTTVVTYIVTIKQPKK